MKKMTMQVMTAKACEMGGMKSLMKGVKSLEAQHKPREMALDRKNLPKMKG